MKVSQIFTKNRGIKNGEFVTGYSPDLSGPHFDKKNPLHIMHSSVAGIIDSFDNVESVLDIGSGSGSLCHFLRKINPSIKAVTLDGNPLSADSPFIEPEKHFVVRTDEEYELVDENNKTINFDLICSFEHFEHINPDTFDVFLDNIKKHSHPNTLVWATASAFRFENEEEAHLHCNVKSHKEWTLFLEKCGFEVLPTLPLAENISSLHEYWAPPHGRLAVSHEFLFKMK